MNTKVGFPNSVELISIEKTVNYEELLRIVQASFEQSSFLLEELVLSISAEIKLQFPQIMYSMVSIKKLNPPLNASIESSEVILEKKYED